MCVRMFAETHLKRVQVAHVEDQHVRVHRPQAERLAVVPFGQIVDRELGLAGGVPPAETEPSALVGVADVSSSSRPKTHLRRHVEDHQLPDARVAHQTAAVDAAPGGAHVAAGKFVLEKLLHGEKERERLIYSGNRWIM